MDTALIEQINQVSKIDPAIVLQQPLSDVIELTLNATCDSKHSRRSYQRGITIFVEYLEERYKDRIADEYKIFWMPFIDGPTAILRLVNSGDLEGFRHYLIKKGNSLGSVNVREYAVRSFLSVAFREGALTPLQAQSMNIKVFRARRKNYKRVVGRRLDGWEVKLLRSAVDSSTVKGKRDLLILDVMLFLGLRRQEVVDIQLDHFIRDRGGWWLLVQGKGQKERKLKLPNGLSLDRWLDQLGVQMGENGYLFRPLIKGGRILNKGLAANTINLLICEYGYKAGIAQLEGKGRLAPHDLRRTAARTAYDNGASLLQIQKMLGHASSQTTERYIGKLNDDDTAMDYIHY